MSKKFQFFVAFFVILILDQLSKGFARGLGIVTFNSGISFSLFDGVAGAVYVVVTIVLLGVIGKWLWSVWLNNLVAFGLLCGAAISNAVDRLFFNGVQDFLPVPFLHIQNNVADWVIFGVLFWVLTEVQKAGKKMEKKVTD
jgi:lipoprotein signal peptidase